MNLYIELEDDQFIPIPDFEQYLINKKGQIKKFCDNGTVRYLKYGLVNGYPRCSLLKKVGKKQKVKKFNFFVHRLVASIFVFNDKPTKKKLVNHKDLDKANYYYTNLEWITPSGNNIHYHQTKTYGRNTDTKENKENQLQ